MALHCVNVLEENVKMAQSDSDQIGHKSILEKQDFNSRPNEWEVATLNKKKSTFDSESEHKSELFVGSSFTVDISKGHKKGC